MPKNQGEHSVYRDAASLSILAAIAREGLFRWDHLQLIVSILHSIDVLVGELRPLVIEALSVREHLLERRSMNFVSKSAIGVSTR